MTRILHRAWRKALKHIGTGRGVYVMRDERGGLHCLLALRKGCRLLAIVGMRDDGRPDVVRL